MFSAGAASDRNEIKRHAGVLVLRELAVNAPALFYMQINSFYKVIFIALRDAKVRRRACVCACGCGCVSELLLCACVRV